MNAMNSKNDFMDRVTESDVIEAEQIFLAGVFGENELLKDCPLVEHDFIYKIHQDIFRQALHLFNTRQHIDTVSIKPGLPKFIEKLDISPAEYAQRLMFRGADPAVRQQVPSKIEIIKGSSLARIASAESGVLQSLAEEGHSLVTLADEIEKLKVRFSEHLARLSSLRSSISPGTAYLQMFDAACKRDGMVGVPIALQEIANVLSEPVFEAGNLYGLLSSSGEGKSSLTMQLIERPLMDYHPVLFLSYDQSPGQCVRQMVAQIHGVGARQQRDPSRMMTDREREKCIQFATQLEQYPFEIIRCQREGVAQLVAYARRFIKQHANGKTPFIVIDHIGKVKPRDPKLSADRISGEVTVELKALADETQSAVLILNQRNSFGTRRDNPRPIAADLYGGEGARADYDAVMFLYRPEKYKAERMATAATDSDWKKIHKVFGDDIEDIAEIGAIKVRFGDPNIREKLKFEAEYTRYASMKRYREQELDL